jgi:hypothetical protein
LVAERAGPWAYLKAVPWAFEWAEDWAVESVEKMAAYWAVPLVFQKSAGWVACWVVP